ncbi:MAG: cell division protein FtsA [Acidobacteria bacterium ACB1]|nr:cell division protein FtsA [Acidobacteria bacterium ACB1]
MSNDIHAIGLDVGTSRVRCIVAEPADDGKLNIIGVGEAESRGMRRGIVTSTEAVADAIRKAVGEAERVSGLEIESATVNFSGEHFQGENKAGVVAVAGANKEISEDDIERAIDSASAMPLQPGWEIVDRLPQEFIIDGQDGIIEPIGMTGSRLEARVHVVTSPSAGKQNLAKAVERAGLDIEQSVLEPLAAAESSITDDDREYGCAVVNFGAELTDLTIYTRGAVQHTAVFPFGSTHFTKDIARHEVIESLPVGRSEKRGLSKEILADIMQPRAVELLQHIARETRKVPLQISSGVVLTGGGSMVRGLCEIAEQVFDAPTRLGFPEKHLFGGLIEQVQTPAWAVACGLASFSYRSALRDENSHGRGTVRRVADWFDGLRKKIK